MSHGTNKRLPDQQYFSGIKQSTAENIIQLDRRLSKLSETILPRQPYLLSVPSDVPYRHSSRFINNWHEGTPFDSTEEQLQYISFLSHQAEHESLLKVEGAWADDQGNRIDEDELSPRTVPNTGHTTPAGSAQRKKISLKDYKTKARSPDPSSRPASSRPPTATRSPPPRLKSPVVDTSGLDLDILLPKPVDLSKAQKEVPAKTTTPKPPAESGQPPVDSFKSDPSNTAKRRKLSPPFEETRTPKMQTKVESHSVPMKMPRLLSPTLPSPDRSKTLPDLLSPLLPASLTLALSSPSDTVSIGSPAIAPQTRTEPVRAILAGADLDGSPSIKNGHTNSTARIRSDSQPPSKNPAPESPNPAKIALNAKPLSKSALSNNALSNGARASPGPRQRHIVSLKYGKKNRKRVEALLKFASRSKKVPVKLETSPSKDVLESRPKKDPPVRETADDLAYAVVRPKKESVRSDPSDSRAEKDPKPKNTIVEGALVEKKRRGGDSPPNATKKLKTSTDNEKRPSTPVPSTQKLSSNAQSKSTFSTPKRDLKPAAMRRVESADGLDAPTPTGERGRVSTPSVAPKPSPQPLTTTTSREEERQQWSSMNTKYFALGRLLKNEGTSLVQSSAGDASSANSPKAVVLLVEALLCFMINISAQAQARPRVDPGWSSIIPYHIFVFRASRKYPHLHGLVVQLGAVCRQLIHNCDMDRLARDPLPEDFCSSAPTPGSDGNTKTDEDVEKYKKQYVRFRDELIHNARELQTAWLDGSRHLPPDILKRDYPATWSKRAKDSMQRLQDKPTPSQISKEFYLPLDANTTAFEAVRFGLTLLQEWSAKERVDWKTRIDL